MPTATLPAPSDDAPRPREAAILAAIRHVFIDKGFDGASMQDLARAADMSVGNFYRYFPSKAAMVAAMIRHELEEVERQFATLATAPDPLAALRAALHERVREQTGTRQSDGALWAEITAAALRKDELAELVTALEAEATGYLLKGFALATGQPLARVADAFAPHARLVMMLVKVSAMDSGRADPALTALVLRQIDTLLAEIAAGLPADQPKDAPQ